MRASDMTAFVFEAQLSPVELERNVVGGLRGRRFIMNVFENWDGDQSATSLSSGSIVNPLAWPSIEWC